jgi:hypothetical protein
VSDSSSLGDGRASSDQPLRAHSRRSVEFSNISEADVAIAIPRKSCAVCILAGRAVAKSARLIRANSAKITQVVSPFVVEFARADGDFFRLAADAGAVMTSVRPTVRAKHWAQMDQ